MKFLYHSSFIIILLLSVPVFSLVHGQIPPPGHTIDECTPDFCTTTGSGGGGETCVGYPVYGSCWTWECHGYGYTGAGSYTTGCSDGGGGGGTSPPACRNLNQSCSGSNQGTCCGGLTCDPQGKSGSLCKKNGCGAAGKTGSDYADGCCAGTAPDSKGVCQCTTPNPPYNLNPDGKDVCPGTSNLSWQPAGKSYYVRVDENPSSFNAGVCEGPGNPAGKNGSGDECFIDYDNSQPYNFQAGQSYQWWAHVRNTQSGCNTYSNPTYATVDVSSQPTAPTNLLPQTSTMPGSQTISWTAPSNADSNTRYNVYIDDEQNGWNGSCSSPLSGDSCVQNLNATSTNFTFTSAHQYHIWVTAISCSFPASAQVDSFVGVPAPIPTVAIQGNLREYDTPACHNDISTNGLSINISAQYPSGVTPVCTVNPSSGTTKSSYNCNVSFDEFANPTPVATQNLTVSATSTEYQPGYLVDSAACEASGSSSIAIDLAAPTPTTTFTKDLLFKIAKSWIKIKNGSFASSLNVSNPIPLSVTSYDLEDDGSRLFIMASAGNDPGAATARALNIGTADPSSKGWKADYQKLGVLNPATFLEYVKARKEFKEIDNLSELETGKIHVWTGGDLTIEDASKFDNIKGVLISTGTVNITKDFKPSSASVAIIANSITFAGDPEPVEEAEGLFVAETINTGETAAQGLKITGNLVAASGLTNNRTWGSNSRPGIFIIFNPTLYMELLPYVSVSKYEYQQTQ